MNMHREPLWTSLSIMTAIGLTVAAFALPSASAIGICTTGHKTTEQQYQEQGDEDLDGQENETVTYYPTTTTKQCVVAAATQEHLICVGYTENSTSGTPSDEYERNCAYGVDRP